MTTYPDYAQAQALAALRDDDPTTCEGCGEEVPHGELADDLMRLGYYCPQCAPLVRGTMRQERDVPYGREA